MRELVQCPHKLPVPSSLPLRSTLIRHTGRKPGGLLFRSCRPFIHSLLETPKHHLCAGPVPRPRAEPARVPTHMGALRAETKAIAMAVHWVDRHGVPDGWTHGVPDESRRSGLARLLRGQDGHQLPSPGALTSPGPGSPREWPLWDGRGLTAVRVTHSLAFKVCGLGTCSVSSSEAGEGDR